MRKFLIRSLLPVLLFIHLGLSAQKSYQYSLDLNSASDNSIPVQLKSPKINKNVITFSFPKIIPGTYMISDYGKFISDVKAFDGAGKQLPVNRLSDDRWEIRNALSLMKVSYKVEGIFDTKQKHPVYPMAATSIEKEDIVINSPGFFGYFEGLKELPVEVSITRPGEYYASTSMVPASSSKTGDVFKVKNIQELYDEPILYAVPDTASVQVGNCSVLFSVYSPQKKIHANEIAATMQPVLKAVQAYLGGKLPVSKYAFIYYFNSSSEKKSFPPGLGGALEHMTSSFYYLPEMPISRAKTFLVDASTHEFFHIITPLTIASKEIKNFNYDEAVLSKHLWLYEGTTEYNAHYVQERYGLISPSEFLNRLSGKITNSRQQFNDSLPFTELSRESAGKYAAQYNNVYQKGALIGACMDIYLLHLSGGKYALRNLEHDLGVRYGVNRAFDDNTLFDEIGKMTYPEIKDFLLKYVDGPNPVPYEYFFGLAGISFIPKAESQTLTFGHISFDRNENGEIIIKPGSEPNEFGKAMGYKSGDIIYSFNGMKVSPDNLGEVIDSIKQTAKEGNILEARVGRKNDQGNLENLTLSAKMVMVPVVEMNKMELMTNPTEKQQQVQKAWLTNETDKDYVARINSK